MQPFLDLELVCDPPNASLGYERESVCGDGVQTGMPRCQSNKVGGQSDKVGGQVGDQSHKVGGQVGGQSNKNGGEYGKHRATACSID